MRFAGPNGSSHGLHKAGMTLEKEKVMARSAKDLTDRESTASVVSSTDYCNCLQKTATTHFVFDLQMRLQLLLPCRHHQRFLVLDAASSLWLCPRLLAARVSCCTQGSRAKPSDPCPRQRAPKGSDVIFDFVIS